MRMPLLSAARAFSFLSHYNLLRPLPRNTERAAGRHEVVIVALGV